MARSAELAEEPSARAQRGPGEREIVAILHVHTTRSDGRGSAADVARAAREAGVDVVVLTDHNDLEGLGQDGYEAGVLLLRGVEISTDGGHVVALDVPNPDFRFDGDPASVLDDVRELGGWSIAAHPFSRNVERRWSSPEVSAFDGLEIVNWSEDGSPSTLSSMLSATDVVFRPRYGLIRALSPFENSIRYWDRLTRERRIVGVAASDAHGGVRLSRSVFLPFPGYRHAFELFRNHLLLDSPLSGDVAADRARVWSALRAGRIFLALDGLRVSNGFRFTAAGEALEATAPDGPVEIVLLRNGEPVARGREKTLSFTPKDKGAYRVEAFWRGEGSPLDPSIPWILSNPVYVGVPEASPAPPSGQSTIPGDGVLVPTSAGRTVADSRSSVGPPDIDTSGALSFDFRMGDGLSEDARSHVAFEIPAPPDAAHARGVSFRLRATGVFRFDVQMRDRNPRSSDGVEPWRRSVKTSTEWQSVFISFRELKSYHQATDGSFSPEDAVGIAFYLDTATVRPGAAGRLFIDELRLHPR